MTSPKRYGLYGLSMVSDFPFVSHLGPGSAGTDLSFTVVDEPPLTAPEWGQPVVHRPGHFSLYGTTDRTILHFAGEADYFLRPDHIECHVPEGGSRSMVEIRLLGSTLALWLEQRGVLALHASAVVVDGYAIAFTAGNGGGKSSLAASFMQAGFPLLSDDILPIDPGNDHAAARPGYPQMRMWPREASHFVGRAEDLPVVHPAFDKRRVAIGADCFGAFCHNAVPLAAIFLLQEHRPGIDSVVTVDTLPGRDAVFEAMAASFAAPVVRGLGEHARRLRAFSDLAAQVGLYHLRYDRGLEHLPLVRDIVLDHVRRTTKARIRP